MNKNGKVIVVKMELVKVGAKHLLKTALPAALGFQVGEVIQGNKPIVIKYEKESKDTKETSETTILVSGKSTIFIIIAIIVLAIIAFATFKMIMKNQRKIKPRVTLTSDTEA